MRFNIKNINQLKNAAEVCDNGDRITIITQIDDKLREYTRNYTFIVTDRNILLRDIIDEEE